MDRNTNFQINPLNKADGGQPGGNIRVGFLFNPDRVGFVARRGSATQENSIEKTDHGPQLKFNPGRIVPDDSAFIAGRKSLAAEFTFNGQKIFLINNHLKSKRGDNGVFGANQPPKFNTEKQRNRQALAIHKLVAEILKQDPKANVIVLGDMNEHEFRVPMKTLAGSLLVNLIEKESQEDRYTYIFNGNSQVLDHIFVSHNLAADAEIDIVHVNAEFAGGRSSDHDPVITRLHLSSN